MTGKHDKRRKSEGVNRNEWLCRIKDIAREELGIEKGVPDIRVSAVIVGIIKSENKLSYRCLVDHFAKYPSDLELCELKKAYKKSWYQRHVSEIDSGLQMRIIARMGDDDADGTLMTDSGGFSVSSYKSWTNAKYGPLSVKEYHKLHILQCLNGKICAARVTVGEANDSPVLREMLTDVRPGTGDVLGDSAYCNKQLCCNLRHQKYMHPDAKIKQRRKRIQRLCGYAAILRRASRNVLQKAEKTQQY